MSGAVKPVQQVAKVLAFPLEWPEGWPRAKARRRSKYTVTFSIAYEDLAAELRRMGAQSIVVSSNVPVSTKTAEPYKDAGSRRMDDPGVAVYFFWKDENWVIACDTWDHVKDNMRACGVTIEALRTIERSGASELLKRAHTAFKALPAPGQTSNPTAPLSVATTTKWHEVLGVSPNAEAAVIEASFRALAKAKHPDNPATGNRSDYDALIWARNEGRVEVSKRARQPVKA